MINKLPLSPNFTAGRKHKFLSTNECIVSQEQKYKISQLLTEDMFFRVTQLSENNAELINNQCLLTIKLKGIGLDNNVKIGDIVSVKLCNHIQTNDPRQKIKRLIKHEQPNSSVNLFNLLPHDWVKDRALVLRALVVFNSISKQHQLLFNSIFWDAERFKRFCICPSSMSGHHSSFNGNLRHTIEVAEIMIRLFNESSFVNFDLGILAALLHDAGKADEYISSKNGHCYLSERGKLLGHKFTSVEWIVAASSKWNIQLPTDHYVGLLHILSAAPNAPDWLGIRQPALPEAHLLSIADRLSGQEDLIRKTINMNGGFGQHHKHLKSPPFLVRGQSIQEKKAVYALESFKINKSVMSEPKINHKRIRHVF